MNEKFVKVEILIDTTNPEQLKSLGSLLTTIGSIEVPAPEAKPEAPAAPEAPKPAQTKKRNTKPAEPAPAPEARPKKRTSRLKRLSLRHRPKLLPRRRSTRLKRFARSSRRRSTTTARLSRPSLPNSAHRTCPAWTRTTTAHSWTSLTVLSNG